MSDEEYNYEEEYDVRECDESCGHFDEINLCCWVATNRGMCTDVALHDLCLFGFSTQPYGDFKIKGREK